MEKNLALREAFSHILKELEIASIATSLSHGVNNVGRAHDAIHEFIYLASLCLPSTPEVNWLQKSAFLTYHFEAFYQAHRSFVEALSGYYNAAYVLLRSTLELMVKGAFFECLAHRKFRDRAVIISKSRRDKGTVVDWINGLIKEEPSIEHQLEGTSGAIFDKMACIFEDSDFRKQFIYVPSFREMVEQLSDWNILDPIRNPIELAYDRIYAELSKNVHVIPDKTDIGRRLLLQKSLFEPVVIPRELSKFTRILHKVIDFGIVIELNLFDDWITHNEQVKTKIRERLAVLEQLKLKISLKKLVNILKQ